MDKVDLKKELKPLYQPSSKEVVRIDVPTMNFLMVDGEGDPNTSQPFKDAIEALFSLSYTLKFMVKKRKNLIALSKVRFEAFSEGTAAQTMHIGPFSEEGPTIERVHAFIARCGCTLSGKHHEIYLSDIRRADPKKWKTIVRQPMAK
ncbi:MAG: hypothetical protein A3J94_11650 [Syntrophus sp. RIFOXYC2_FULL_54_9]|nr:MAG: hypothetical protein A3J94_11650 [Syntrophus sp. RIFOXYC2_FULL_54_9]